MNTMVTEKDMAAKDIIALLRNCVDQNYARIDSLKLNNPVDMSWTQCKEEELIASVPGVTLGRLYVAGDMQMLTVESSAMILRELLWGDCSEQGDKTQEEEEVIVVEDEKYVTPIGQIAKEIGMDPIMMDKILRQVISDYYAKWAIESRKEKLEGQV